MTESLERPGVFVDRDGTLIEDPGYLRDPAAVRLLPGVGHALARLNAAGIPVVVVSNQSGIARGLLTEAAYHDVQRRLAALLAAEGARFDAEEFCPHLPEITGPCECRKPGVLLFRRAAGRLDIDLARSWWVGDRLRDVLPAETFGGTGILVRTGQGEAEAADPHAARFTPEPDLPAAVDRILACLP
jgi:D-glycero-D-manno-heptose 1,7-bisphosphate phosphatase